MYFITRPAVVALIVGTLGFLGYELWSRAPDWAKGTVFAQSPGLLGVGMVLLFFGAAILIFVVCRRLVSRKRNALR
jgi:ABC-type dipeptide/oligopeptide/nickel transport system permease subunit